MIIKKGDEIQVAFYCVATEDTDSSILMDDVIYGFPTMRVFNPSYRVIEKK